MIQIRRRTFFIAFLLLLDIAASTWAMAQSKRGITAEDYFSFKLISDPHLSPDGTQVAYVLNTVDEKKNRRESSVWVMSVDGIFPARRLSVDGSKSTFPRWSPDGSAVAMISADPKASEDDAKEQIYVVPMREGGEPAWLPRFHNSVKAFQWSPDGTKMVVVSSSDPQNVGTKSDVRHYRHIIYKFSETGWDNGKRQHLWVLDIPTGETKQITDGQDWNDTDPQWSPDGTRIAFVSDRSGKAYDSIRNNSDVWTIPARGGSLTKISDHDFADESPRWSPDGKKILFNGKTAYHQFFKLYVTDANGSQPSKLALKNLDVIPTELHWPTGERFLFQSRARGESQIFRGDLPSGAISAITLGPRTVQSFDVKAGKMIYLANDSQHLDDLYLADLDGHSERQLTHLNQDLWNALKLSPVGKFQYASKDGLKIDGFFLKPLDWQPGKKYPMITVIHGGPRDMFGVDWYQEFQVYAAKGWSVFYCNPRGSLGYGEDFERKQINNWGVMDYQDIMSGVDAVVQQNPWVDATRLGVTGGSYGGYMTNWIVSHTDRFKAAVTLRSLSNFISDEGTRWQPYGHEEYFKGPLFDDLDQYWEASPLKYAHNVHTPTLILHSDNDFQLPLEQGEQWFRALQHYGVPSELVIFPRENHDMTRTGEPKHLVESLNWQVYWFDRYLNENSEAKAPDAQ